MINEAQVKSSPLINKSIIGVITEKLLLIAGSSPVLSHKNKLPEWWNW